MKRLLLIAALASVGCGTSQAPAAAEGATHTERTIPQLTVAEVAGRANELAVFDANIREMYDSEHVPGAVWIDYDGVTREQLPSALSAPLVFYCANEMCSASHTAAEMAMDLGYTNVSVMGAGIEGWVAAGQPVERPGAVATP